MSQISPPSQARIDQGYFATHLSHVIKTYDNDLVDLIVKIYFPDYPAEQIQVKVGRRSWQSLNPDEDGLGQKLIERVTAGTSIQFRYWDRTHRKWQPLAPLTDLERVHEVFYIPKLAYTWQHDPPQFNHGRVLMETTLEGILAGYEGGVFAPRSREELFLDPISSQLLRTDILNRLAEFGIDEIMIPTCSSVADLSRLDPRFSYLAYDVADIDWQLGPVSDMVTLIDALFAKGLELVPDLVFAHQVRTPFPGSLDQIRHPDTQAPFFVDTEAMEFRAYGTWMFNLADPMIRRQLIEKIVSFVSRYRIKMIRLGYLDGLLWQYSQRDHNYGETFLQELDQELQQASPDTLILGELFKAQDRPVVETCVDIFHAPYGFPIVEELYKPPTLRSRPLFADVVTLVPALQQAIECQHYTAIYAQLHDESYQSNHWSEDRADVPWAYGANPAELAKGQGEELINLNLLPPEDLLDYVRRTVRNAEALTMFTAKLMYMFVPTVDSLALESLDSAGSWKLRWDDVDPDQLNFWGKRGLSDRQIYLLHKQHRLDMARLRQIFRSYTIVTPNTLKPLTEIAIYHVDPEHAVVCLWRYNSVSPYESILILFNLGPVAFKVQTNTGYALSPPSELGTQWEVLFDGDWIDPLLRAPDRRYYLDTNEDLMATAPGTLLSLSTTTDADKQPTLDLNLGAFSLLVLKPHR